MLRAWRNTNMDARRWISLLIAVGGLAVVAIGIAASPVSAFGSNDSGAVGPVFGAAVGPVFGAALAGYLRHRVSDPERAPLWALAYGASVAVILVATFGLAAMIHSTVRGIPGFGDAWYGVIVSGLFVAFVGAFLWTRDAGGVASRRWDSLGCSSWSAGSSWGREETGGQRGRTSPSAPPVRPCSRSQ